MIIVLMGIIICNGSYRLNSDHSNDNNMTNNNKTNKKNNNKLSNGVGRINNANSNSSNHGDMFQE